MDCVLVVCAGSLKAEIMTDKTHWKRLVTHSRLKQLLSYDPNTGVFVWVENRRCIRAGSIAGTVNSHGYSAIKIDGRLYTAHRLAWLWVTGIFPSEEIDHVNRVRLDNRFINLRIATSSQNKVNTGIRADNTTGIKGVSYCAERKKFVAQITHQGKARNLGRYSSMSEANAAYTAAAEQLHGHFLPSGENS